MKILELDAIPEGKRDPSIMDRVQLEGPGILIWALEGLARLNDRGRFEYPESVRKASARFLQENDLPGTFLEERCERVDGCIIHAARLTEEFNGWLKENGHAGEWSTKKLAAEWRRLRVQEGGKDGYPERDGKGKLWHGIRLSDRF